MKLIFFLFLFLNNYYQTLFSQSQPSFQLIIEVKNLDNDAPVVGARVFITRVDSIRIFGITDENGLFIPYNSRNEFLLYEMEYEIRVILKGKKTSDTASHVVKKIQIEKRELGNCIYKTFKIRQLGCTGSKFNMNPITFAQNSALPDSNAKALNNVLDLMQKNKYWQIKMIYHNSSFPPECLWAQKRLDYTINYLTKHGIEAERIIPEMNYPGFESDEINTCTMKIIRFDYKYNPDEEEDE
jgi:hypothetical protein